MKNCIYCNKNTIKKNAGHFQCTICGAAMCHDCYDKDTEHILHFHAINLTILNTITLQTEPGDYICTSCIDSGEYILIDENDKNSIEKLWELLGNVPVNSEDEIEQNFYMWEEGTDKFEIWHWFDEKLKEGLGKYLETKGEI